MAACATMQKACVIHPKQSTDSDRPRPLRRVSFEQFSASSAAPMKRRCPPSWARLISKVYQAAPLVCKGCGGPLKIVAYITDELSIRRILDHLGLNPPEQENPPPTREVVRVPADDEGREIQAG